MADGGNTGFNWPIIDLTNDCAQSSNHTIPCIDLTGNGDTNHSPELIDLTNDDTQYFNSPVINLNRDNSQFLNYRTPVIDLTKDDVQDIPRQIQCIDLANDSISSHTNNMQYFDLTKGDKHTNRSTVLTYDGNQDANTPVDQDLNIPVILSRDNQFLNYRVPDIEMEIDDVQDIIHQIQCIDLTGNEKQNVNSRIPAINLTNDNGQSINQNIPAGDLPYYENSNKDRPIFDLIQKDDDIRNSSDVEMVDEVMSYNNTFSKIVTENFSSSPATIPKCVTEVNPRISSQNFRDEVIENNAQKFNETSNIDLMDADSSNIVQPCYGRKEIILPNHPPANNFQEKDLSPRRSEKIIQNTESDFMKPADYPIPLRHSLGRSTVYSSKNVLIECKEVSEGQSRTLTVSSTLRRKKSESSRDIFKKNLPNSSGQSRPLNVSSTLRRKKLESSRNISEKNLPKSSELSPARTNAYYFDTFKGFFINIWIFLVYWISKTIRR